MKSLPDIIDPGNTLESNVVLPELVDAGGCYTFMDSSLEDIWLRNLDVRGMGCWRRGNRWINIIICILVRRLTPRRRHFLYCYRKQNHGHISCRFFCFLRWMKNKKFAIVEAGPDQLFLRLLLFIYRRG